jgi:serine/threonine-protein kinase RsbW
MQRNGDAPQIVSLTIPAEARWLALCRLVLSGVCRLGAVDDEELADLKLAVTEACSNSVRHAYDEDGGVGLVDLRYELSSSSVRVVVSDAGHGFRFDGPVPELTSQPEEELREDEMGLAIIHALVDEVEIGAGPEGLGTKIALTKYLGA